jgi:hypothetical protein
MVAKRKALGVDEIYGAWPILCTPAIPEASSWKTENSVDLDETARVVEALIGQAFLELYPRPSVRRRISRVGETPVKL